MVPFDMIFQSQNVVHGSVVIEANLIMKRKQRVGRTVSLERQRSSACGTAKLRGVVVVENKDKARDRVTANRH